VALGESANTIVVVDVADPRHMRVLRRLHPAAQAHDIAFDPDWQRSVGIRSRGCSQTIQGCPGLLISNAPPNDIAASPRWWHGCGLNRDLLVPIHR
jgi:hypothetical protein